METSPSRSTRLGLFMEKHMGCVIKYAGKYLAGTGIGLPLTDEIANAVEFSNELEARQFVGFFMENRTRWITYETKQPAADAIGGTTQEGNTHGT